MTDAILRSNRLHLAHKDMEDVKRYLDALQELVVVQHERKTSEYFDHCEAILIAAVVAYCRPFKNSRSAGFADKSLNVETLNCMSVDPALRKLHDLIVLRRDKAIAHGDWEMRSTELLNRIEGSATFRRTPIPDLLSGLDPQGFWDLAHQVSVECLRNSYDLDRATQSGSGA